MADQESDPQDRYPDNEAHTSPRFDEDALIRHWEKDVTRAARSVACGGAVDVEDLAQEARLRVLKAVRAFPAAPEQYLRRVIANAVRSARRRELRARDLICPGAPDIDQLDVASEPPIDQVPPVATWAVGLSGREQDLCRHLYVEGRTQREVAALMEISQPRVAQLHRRLLDRWREALSVEAA